VKAHPHSIQKEREFEWRRRRSIQQGETVQPLLTDSKYNPAAQILEEAKNNTFKGRQRRSDPFLAQILVQGQ
jgi:hypothetical protein